MDPQPSRWYKGQSPDSGDPAGYPARGDDHPDKPHLRVFPRHGSQVEEVFQETRPIWLTENMAANMVPGSGSGHLSVVPAGIRLAGADDSGSAKGIRMFPTRQRGEWRVGEFDQVPAPAKERRTTASSAGSTDRAMQNFQSQLQEDIYQRFRHIKDAFLSMDRTRTGTVDRDALHRLCQMCNLGEANVGILVDAFDRSGSNVWDFNEFVTALKRTDYSEHHEGLAAIGAPHEYEGQSVRTPSSRAESRPAGEEGGAAPLISPGAVARVKTRRDLRGRELRDRVTRPASGAGQRVEHALVYAQPQERARLLSEAFKRLDRDNRGRISRSQLISWENRLLLKRDGGRSSYQLTLKLDAAMKSLFTACEASPDQCIPLPTFLFYLKGDWPIDEID
eukprot:COSAG05_NODE_78_length_21399_cov_26.298216_18_plen_392_part_00